MNALPIEHSSGPAIASHGDAVVLVLDSVDQLGELRFHFGERSADESRVRFRSSHRVDGLQHCLMKRGETHDEMFVGGVFFFCV